MPGYENCFFVRASISRHPAWEWYSPAESVVGTKIIGKVGDLTCSGGFLFIGLINGGISDLFIGEGRFSSRRAESLHASVIEPPPRVRIQSALKGQRKFMREGDFVERISSAILIASSHGEFCPTPYFVPTTYLDRKSRYCFPLGEEARDLDITRYGD